MHSDHPGEEVGSIGGPLPWFQVSLLLYGVKLEPRQISETLGCEATSFHKAGEPRFSRSAVAVPFYEQGMWCVTHQKGDTEEDIESAIRRVLERVRSTKISELPGVEHAKVSVAADLPDWTRGFDLSAELIALLRDYGLSFGLTVYRDEEKEAEPDATDNPEDAQ